MRAAEITATAADWLIRLEGQPSAESWDAFLTWIDTDPRHRAAFIRLRAAWTRCDPLKNMRPADGQIDTDLLYRPRRQLEQHSRPRMNRRVWIAGAVAASAAGLFFLERPAASEWLDIETAVGATRRWQLADGTGLRLNTNSRARIHLSSHRRDIQLLRGEAQFAVAHDRARPFAVMAAGMLVQTLGTRFSLRLLEDQSLEILVEDGRVAIGAAQLGPDHVPRLPPSGWATAASLERAVCAGGAVTLSRLQADTLHRKLAWINGVVALNFDTLENAVREFNRYNHKRLVIADPAIAQMRIGGNFATNDLKTFVQVLPHTINVITQPSPRKNDDVILLVGGPPRGSAEH